MKYLLHSKKAAIDVIAYILTGFAIISLSITFIFFIVEAINIEYNDQETLADLFVANFNAHCLEDYHIFNATLLPHCTLKQSCLSAKIELYNNLNSIDTTEPIEVHYINQQIFEEQQNFCDISSSIICRTYVFPFIFNKTEQVVSNKFTVIVPAKC